MAKAFTDVVSKYGRNAETELIRKYYFRTNPLKMIGQMPMVLKLMKRKRLDFLPHKIKGIDGFRKMMAVVERNGGK